MLELGIQKETGKVVHINKVPNGFKCDCICPNPECADLLNAKNQCKDMSNHFAHRTRVESRTCLMSQLHLAAQHYFLNLKSFTIPKQVFRYDGCAFEVQPKTVSIQRAELEVSIDKFRVDVLLHTDVGEIIIEVLVTSKCSEEKTAYLKDAECPTLEYDLSAFVDIELKESMAMLADSVVPYNWIFGWYQNQLIEDYLKDKETKRKNELLKQKRSAVKSAKKLIDGRYLLLPSIDEKFECTLDGVRFEEEIRLFTRREYKLASLEIESENEKYLLLKGMANNSLGSRKIWAAYLYTQDVPAEIKDITDAVVVRYPTLGNKSKSTWVWLNNPRLEQLRAEKMQEFILKCHQDLALRESTLQYSKMLTTLASNYSGNQDNYFRQGYGVWKNWLIENKFFTPTPSKKNPSIPNLLKMYRTHPNLWMFDTWAVLVITKLAKIVDNIPLNTLIDHLDVFSALSREFPLHADYVALNNLMSTKFLEESQQNLLSKSHVIRSTLTIFMDTGAIRLRQGRHYRIRSLLTDITR